MSALPPWFRETGGKDRKKRAQRKYCGNADLTSRVGLSIGAVFVALPPRVYLISVAPQHTRGLAPFSGRRVQLTADNNL